MARTLLPLFSPPLFQLKRAIFDIYHPLLSTPVHLGHRFCGVRPLQVTQFEIGTRSILSDTTDVWPPTTSGIFDLAQSNPPEHNDAWITIARTRNNTTPMLSRWHPDTTPWKRQRPRGTNERTNGNTDGRANERGHGSTGRADEPSIHPASHTINELIVSSFYPKTKSAPLRLTTNHLRYLHGHRFNGDASAQLPDAQRRRCDDDKLNLVRVWRVVSCPNKVSNPTKDTKHRTKSGPLFLQASRPLTTSAECHCLVFSGGCVSSYTNDLFTLGGYC
ncbi:hypothetical protein CCMSSC00406_0010437 [Pleurotus cornucopiae]|uniref:Uncharacterized protein n=1 Tax=Pleurotus cornucopiae TaxID=5321 RepID=A0ACB7IZG8_PLECO|nr:hypothetical protein CCMSSC00406_0010437 [Pleurotus cornucopiae]